MSHNNIIVCLFLHGIPHLQCVCVVASTFTASDGAHPYNIVLDMGTYKHTLSYDIHTAHNTHVQCTYTYAGVDKIAKKI